MSQKAVRDALSLFTVINKLSYTTCYPNPLLKDNTLMEPFNGNFANFTYLKVPVTPNCVIRYVKNANGYNSDKFSYVIIEDQKNEELVRYDSPYEKIDLTYTMPDYGYVSLSGTYTWVSCVYILDINSIFFPYATNIIEFIELVNSKRK